MIANLKKYVAFAALFCALVKFGLAEDLYDCPDPSAAVLWVPIWTKDYALFNLDFNVF